MVFLDKNSEKKIYQVLQNLLGLGNSSSNNLCKKFGFQKKCRLKDLDSSDLELLKNHLVSNYFLDKLLIEKIKKNVKNKIDLGIYEGKRHNLGYPVRGQRTLSNGKTQKKLYKFRFYYDSELFSHNFFKNQRKSTKQKKISNLKKKKNYFQKTESKYKSSSYIRNNSKNLILKQLKKKEDKNIVYLNKLEKIKSERKAQIETNFKREHAQAVKTHPYFRNIQKGKASKAKKKK